MTTMTPTSFSEILADHNWDYLCAASRKDWDQGQATHDLIRSTLEKQPELYKVYYIYAPSGY